MDPQSKRRTVAITVGAGAVALPVTVLAQRYGRAFRAVRPLRRALQKEGISLFAALETARRVHVADVLRRGKTLKPWAGKVLESAQRSRQILQHPQQAKTVRATPLLGAGSGESQYLRIAASPLRSQRQNWKFYGVDRTGKQVFGPIGEAAMHELAKDARTYRTLKGGMQEKWGQLIQQFRAMRLNAPKSYGIQKPGRKVPEAEKGSRLTASSRNLLADTGAIQRIEQEIGTAARTRTGRALNKINPEREILGALYTKPLHPNRPPRGPIRPPLQGKSGVPVQEGERAHPRLAQLVGPRKEMMYRALKEKYGKTHPEVVDLAQQLQDKVKARARYRKARRK